MSLALLSQLYLATLMRHRAGNAVFNNNQTRLGLANTVLPTSNPSSLFQQDKALELMGLRNQINYEVAGVLEDLAHKGWKKEIEHHQKALQNGQIF